MQVKSCLTFVCGNSKLFSMSDKKEKQRERAEKREAALRANLQRRKQQARARVSEEKTKGDDDNADYAR